MRRRSVMAGPKRSAVSSTGGPVIVWFRLDLRLEDNSALRAAVRTAASAGIIPVYISAPEEEAPVEAPETADLVVLNGNAASRISDLENVEIVFKQGVGYDPAKLIQSVTGLVGLR